MTIYLEEESEIRLPVECRKVAEQVVEEALDYERFPYEAEVEILHTHKESIREMNREQRGIDRPTDVLSFPMIDYETAGEFDFLEERPDCFHPETGEALLGDIVISKEKVLSQAEEYGHSPLREYAFLIAHSMLHLLGYDHMEEKERLVMEKKQNEILERLGISRSGTAKDETK